MTKIYAHRGYSKLYPENTMIAFKKALEAGADGIELDIHLTKDQNIVIIHDDDLKRTTDQMGKIKDLTLSEIQKANILHHEIKNEKVPTLDSFFTWVKSTPLCVNIEIKAETNGVLEQLLLNRIQHFQLEKQIVISSFYESTLIHIHNINPAIETAYLYDAFSRKHLKKIQQKHIHSIHPNYRKLMSVDVKQCIQNKVILRPYTVNRASKLKQLMKLGIEAIITDDVELALEIKKTLNG